MDGPWDDHTKWKSQKKKNKYNMISFIGGIQIMTQMNLST